MSGEAFGTWKLDELIAVGGTAEVWRATREADGATCALKRLHTHLQRNDEARGLFQTECMLATALPRHANVARAIEAGKVESRPYLALEIAPGEVLRQIVAPAATRDAPRPVHAVVPRARAVAIVKAACAGVAHIHRAGWVHGDVNPGNLVIDARMDGDHVVVVDLGIARRAGTAGAVRGTHAYMAPEQVKAEAWTPATDVFALGVILWELLAGERLFHRGPPWLSMAAVVEHTPAPLPDAALDAVVSAALAKSPMDRIQTATELASRLGSG